MTEPPTTSCHLFAKAEAFLVEAYGELGATSLLQGRIKRVAEEIAGTGSWVPTTSELTMGARLAWRNSNRCIGRLLWKSLKVMDARSVVSTENVLDALQYHLDYAFNDGRIRSAITIFGPSKVTDISRPRILNHQLLRFAGYRHDEESPVLGDPAEVSFTKHCHGLGWRGAGTQFDLLPWVIRWPGQPDAWRMPRVDPRLLVEIEHPEHDWFRELDLRWYAVPVISDMLLEMGGVEYTAAPFNGWYMETEIGCRNFGDSNRYNLLPEIARRLGLDTITRHSLWQDRALVELNRAVLYSFERSGVTIVDHHTAAEQFVKFETLEQRQGRELMADWAWITPPLSGSTTPVFHRHYENTVRSPNFFYQEPVLPEVFRSPSPADCPFHAKNRQQ